MPDSRFVPSPALVLPFAGRIAVHPEHAFWTLATAHVLLWTAIPAGLYHSLPRDTLEGIAWGRMWEWGYDKHPPLAAWISAAAFDLLGEWGVFLAAQLCVLGALWGVWRLAREVLEPWPAVLAVALLEGVYYYNAASLTLNPNVVMLPAWALLGWLVLRTQAAPSIARWALVGAVTGVSLLAKHESGVLIAALALGLLCTPDGRRALRHRGLAAAAVTGTLVVLPHLAWLVHHDFLPLQYLLGYTGAGAGAFERDVQAVRAVPPPVLFLLEQLGAATPTVAIWALLILRGGSHRRSLPSSTWRLLAWLAVGPLALLIGAAALMHAQLVARWGFPLFTGLTVFLLAWRTPRLDARTGVVAAAAVLAIHFALLTGQWAVIELLPRQTGAPPYSIADPTPELAAHVTDGWHARMRSKLPFVAGSRFLAAGICTYSPDAPRPFFDLRPATNPWLQVDEPARRGMAIVARSASPEQDAQLAAQMRAKYHTLFDDHAVTLEYAGHPQLAPARYWVAYVPPADMTTAELRWSLAGRTPADTAPSTSQR
jgi:4-amino-4-deoxy-L-arabinose transferase-like glycosyltransferase